MLKQISHWFTQLFLGKELGLSVILLHTIQQALSNPKISDVAKFVYNQLPANWRKPQGPISESAFVDVVVAGQAFLGKLQAVLQD